MRLFETDSNIYNISKLISLVSFILIIIFSLVAFNCSWFTFQAKVLTMNQSDIYKSTDYIEGVFHSLSFRINYRVGSSGPFQESVICSYENATQSQQESIYSSSDSSGNSFTYYTCQYDKFTNSNGSTIVKAYTISSDTGSVIESGVITISVVAVGSLICCFLFPETKGKPWFHFIKLIFSLGGGIILMISMIEFNNIFPSYVAPKTSTIFPILYKNGAAWYLSIVNSALFLITSICTVICIITRPSNIDGLVSLNDDEDDIKTPILTPSPINGDNI